MVWGWLEDAKDWTVDKATDTGSALVNVGVGVVQPIAENTVQAATGLTTAVGGVTGAVVGGAVELTGDVLEGAGLDDEGSVAEWGEGLQEYSMGAVDSGLGEVGDAITDTVSTEGEVVAGLQHAAINTQSILFDWSEDDEGFAILSEDGWFESVDYEEERKRYLDAMRSDDTGWTGGGILNAAYGSTFGAAADTWATSVGGGIERLDEFNIDRGYDNWITNTDMEYKETFLDGISDVVILFATGPLVTASAVRNAWKAGGFLTKGGLLLAGAIIYGSRLANFSLNWITPGMAESNDPPVVWDGEDEDDEEEDESDPEDDDGTGPFDEDEDDDPSVTDDTDEERYGRNPTEEELEAQKLAELEEEERLRLLQEEEEERKRLEALEEAKRKGDPRAPPENPYKEREAVW